VLVLAVAVVGSYLLLTSIVVASGLIHLVQHPEFATNWLGEIGLNPSSGGAAYDGPPLRHWLLVALWSFPQVSLGLSGFELTMAVAPLVRGTRRDTPGDPAGRVRNTRKLILTA